jgi:hypothetical protein
MEDDMRRGIAAGASFWTAVRALEKTQGVEPAAYKN